MSCAVNDIHLTVGVCSQVTSNDLAPVALLNDVEREVLRRSGYTTNTKLCATHRQPVPVSTIAQTRGSAGTRFNRGWLRPTESCLQ